MGHSLPLFIFVFLIQLIVNKICWWLDSNRGSLVSEATALPTDPQPLPSCFSMLLLLKIPKMPASSRSPSARGSSTPVPSSRTCARTPSQSAKIRPNLTLPVHDIRRKTFCFATCKCCQRCTPTEERTSHCRKSTRMDQRPRSLQNFFAVNYDTVR